MKVTPVLIGAVCVMVYLLADVRSMLPYGDNPAGVLPLMVLTMLVALVLIVCLIEQVVVNHARPTLKKLILWQGSFILVLCGLILWLVN